MPTIFTAACAGSGVGLGVLGGVVGLLPPGLVIGLRLGFWKILLLVGGFLLANIALGYWEAAVLRRTVAVLSTVVLVELFDEASVSLLGWLVLLLSKFDFEFVFGRCGLVFSLSI